MTKEFGEYTLDRSEYAAAKIFALQIIITQVLSDIIKSKPAEDRRDFLEKLRLEADYLNKQLNRDNNPRDLAWMKEMANTFSTIFDSVSPNLKSQETPNE